MRSRLLVDNEFPYKGFVDRADMYELSSAFWSDAFDSIGLGSEWKPWMPDPLRDGNPIFSRRNQALNRGVLIQQVERSDDPAWFKCWIARFQVSAGHFLPYLFIETFVSAPGRGFFLQLMALWGSASQSESDVEYLARTLSRMAIDDPRLDFDHVPPASHFD